MPSNDHINLLYIRHFQQIHIRYSNGSINVKNASVATVEVVVIDLVIFQMLEPYSKTDKTLLLNRRTLKLEMKYFSKLVILFQRLP